MVNMDLFHLYAAILFLGGLKGASAVEPVDMCTTQKIKHDDGGVLSYNEYPDWIQVKGCQCNISSPYKAKLYLTVDLELSDRTRKECPSHIEIHTHTQRFKVCPTKNNQFATIMQLAPTEKAMFILRNPSELKVKYKVRFNDLAAGGDLTLQCGEPMMGGASLPSRGGVRPDRGNNEPIRDTKNVLSTGDIAGRAIAAVLVSVMIIIILVSVLIKLYYEKPFQQWFGSGTKNLNDNKANIDETQMDNPAYSTSSNPSTNPSVHDVSDPNVINLSPKGPAVVGNGPQPYGNSNLPSSRKRFPSDSTLEGDIGSPIDQSPMPVVYRNSGYVDPQPKSGYPSMSRSPGIHDLKDPNQNLHPTKPQYSPSENVMDINPKTARPYQPPGGVSVYPRTQQAPPSDQPYRPQPAPHLQEPMLDLREMQPMYPSRPPLVSSGYPNPYQGQGGGHVPSVRFADNDDTGSEATTAPYWTPPESRSPAESPTSGHGFPGETEI